MKKSLIIVVMISMLVASGLVVAGPLEDLFSILGFGQAAITGMQTADEDLATNADGSTSDDTMPTEDDADVSGLQESTDETAESDIQPSEDEMAEIEMQEAEEGVLTINSIEAEEGELVQNEIQPQKAELQKIEAIKAEKKMLTVNDALVAQKMLLEKESAPSLEDRVKKLEEQVQFLRKALVECDCKKEKDFAEFDKPVPEKDENCFGPCVAACAKEDHCIDKDGNKVDSKNCKVIFADCKDYCDEKCKKDTGPKVGQDETKKVPLAVKEKSLDVGGLERFKVAMKSLFS